MNTAAAGLYLPPEGYPFPITYPITYPVPAPTGFNTIYQTTSADGNASAAAPPPDERAAKRQKRELPVVCEFCHRTMRTDNLGRHQRRCSENPDRDSKIPCPKCPKSFSRQDALRRHLKKVCPGAREPPPHPFLVTPMGQPVPIPATFEPDFLVPIATRQFEPIPGPSQPVESAIPLDLETFLARIFDTDYMWPNVQHAPVYPLSSGSTCDPSVERTDGAAVDVPRSALPSEVQPDSLPRDTDENNGVDWLLEFLDPAVFELSELPET